VADPERRELHVSIGCAIESICIAADFAGFGTSVGHFPARHDASLVARIRVALAGPKRDQPAADLLDAMAARRTSHRLFEPDRIPGAADIDRLARAAAIFGVELRTLSDPDRLDDLARLEDRADELLFADPAYREELGRGIGDGMLGTSWLLSKLGQFAVGRLGATRPIGAGDVERLSSAPMVGLLVTPGSSPAEAVRVGEAYLRMALLAESAGIRVQPVSQILETTHTRDRLNAVFGVSNAVPQHLFRLGYAAGEPGTRPRRAMRELLVRMQ
jgi:hypothetical protein